MRTTVDIPDEIYRRLKIKAAEDGETVRALILRGVEQTLAETPEEKRKVDFPIIRGDGKRKINLTREQIDEAMFG